MSSVCYKQSAYKLLVKNKQTVLEFCKLIPNEYFEFLCEKLIYPKYFAIYIIKDTDCLLIIDGMGKFRIAFQNDFKKIGKDFNFTYYYERLTFKFNDTSCTLFPKKTQQFFCFHLDCF